MSREIKFRVWDKTTDTMFTGNDLIIDTGSKMVTIDDDSIDYENDVEAVLMQYTGLKDKNGKEIYEGDVLSGGNEYDKRYGTPIIKIGNYDECKELFDEDGDFYELSCTGVYFEFNDNTCTGIDYTCISKFEVTGNIYENPELLEAE